MKTKHPAQSEPQIPWLTFLSVTAAAIGCTFHPGIAVDFDAGGEDNAYACDCNCAPPPVTQTFTIATSTDDAEEYVGSGIVNLASSDLELTYEDGLVQSKQLVGMRFGPLGIPQGATILSAKIQFTVDETTGTSTSLLIRAQASDNAPTFTAAGQDLSSRPLTSTATAVPWTPAPWTVLDEAGPAELTPELKGVLQEVVNRMGWTPESAAAFIVTGDGWRVARAYDFSPALAPRLIVQYQEPGVTVNLSACVPAVLNPNLAVGHSPDAGELADDCTGRIQQTLAGMNAACGYPSLCTCAATPGSGTFAAPCDESCDEVPLASDCSNFNPLADGGIGATNAAGDLPVCLTGSPLSAGLFGQHSRCEVSGTATVQIEGEDTKHPNASGVVEVVGRPCPGQSCAVGLEYAMKLGSVTYDHLFGSATFGDLASTGESIAGAEAMLDSAGNGSFAAETIDLGARGQRDGDYKRLVGTNSNLLDLGVGWADPAPTCALVGSIVGNADPELKRCEDAGPSANAICTSDDDCTDDAACTDGDCNCLDVPETSLALSLDVSGPIVNQPPTANAGSDQVVECNVAGGAQFQLHSLSTDPDGNLALTRWYLGSRTGPEVGVGPYARLQQAVGSTTTYVLRVIDAQAQADEDSAQVQVQDTTPPVLSCNSVAAIVPGTHNVSFTATATDVCDPTVTPAVTAYRCEKNGTPQPCKVRLHGDTLTIINPSGTDSQISWDLRVADASGNVTTRTCVVNVANPSN